MKNKSLLFLNLILLLLLSFACSKDLPELPANDLVEDANYRPVIITGVERLNIDRVRITYEILYDCSKNPKISGVRLLKNGSLSTVNPDLEDTSFSSSVNMNRVYCYRVALTDGDWHSTWSYEVCINT